jgi:hypothetical protein
MTPRLILVGALALVVAPAGTAAAAPAGTYGGTTSQGRTVTLVVGAHKIKRIKITWNARCQTSTTGLDGLVTRFRAVKVRHGRWSAHGSYREPSGNGYSERFQVAVHGRFTRAGVRGKFQGSVVVSDPRSHAYVDSCYGHATLHARPHN